MKREKKLNFVCIAFMIFSVVYCNTAKSDSVDFDSGETKSHDSSSEVFVINYHGNGHTGGVVPLDTNKYSATQSAMLANSGSLTRLRYSFMAWNTKTDGSGIDYLPATSITFANANIDLYAKWQADPTYTITYNGNGNTSGAAPADSNHYFATENVTVSSGASLLRTAYVFIGWNSQADGLGTDYLANTVLNMGTANIVLYAKWTQAPTYLLSYDGNNHTAGNPPSDANQYLNGQSAIIADSATLLRNGHNFIGWNSQADGLGTDFAVGSNFSLANQNVTFFAKWQISTPWIKSVSGASNTSELIAVAQDASGNTYAIVNQTGSAFFTYGSGVSSSGSNDVLIKYDSAGNALWVRRVTNSTSGSATYKAIALDSQNNIYVAGSQPGNETFIYAPGVSIAGSNSSGSNILLLKYDSSGNALWARTSTAGSTNSELSSIAMDQQDNIYVAGQKYGSASHTYDVGVTAAGSLSGGLNVLLIKYNSLGTALWAKSSASGSKVNVFTSVATDKQGNVYAAGYQYGNTAVGYGNSITVSGSNTNANTLLVKYDANGQALWAKSVTSGTSWSYFYGITVDAAENVIVVGSQDGSGNYGFGNAISCAGDASTNVLLVKYNPSGLAQWARSVTGGGSASQFNSVTTDILGNIYAVGFQNHTGTFNYGPGVTATGLIGGVENALLVKYDSAGIALWAKTPQTAPAASVFSTAIADKSGNIFIGGYQTGSSSFTYAPGVTVTGSATSSKNMVIVKYIYE